MDYQNIIANTAIGLSVAFFLTLVIPFFNVLRCKLNYEFTPIALINTIYVDSIAWYIYADKIICQPLKLCHTIGAICTLLLIIIYLAFELKKYLVDSILNLLILILGTLVMHKGLTIVVEDAQMVGKVCIATKLITFFTPILMIYRVIKEKNYKLISINNTFTCMCACIGWVLYGKFTNDINIMIPNIAGIVLCFIQFIVYLNIKKKYPHYVGPSSTIGIETTSGDDVKKGDNAIKIDEDSEIKGKEKPVEISNKN